MAFSNCSECGGPVHSRKNRCLRCGTQSTDVALQEGSTDSSRKESSKEARVGKSEAFAEYSSYPDSLSSYSISSSKKSMNPSKSRNYRRDEIANKVQRDTHYELRNEAGELEQRAIDSYEKRREAQTELQYKNKRPLPLMDENQSPREATARRNSLDVKRHESDRIHTFKDTYSSEKKHSNSPTTKQILFAALLLFVLFVFYDLGKDYLRAASVRNAMQQRADQLAQLKQRELKRSTGIIFVRELHEYTTCKEWSEYHSNLKDHDVIESLNFHRRMCTQRGNY